jgi:AAA15 family ATPase/GTPase
METTESNTPVYIKEITIDSYRNFKGNHDFKFVDENGKWCQWTVFLGNNNSGKTNLLKIIAAMQPQILKPDKELAPTVYKLNPFLFETLLPNKNEDIQSSTTIFSDKNESTLEWKTLDLHSGLKEIPVPSLWHSFKVFGYGVFRRVQRETSKKSLLIQEMARKSNYAEVEKILIENNLSEFESKGSYNISGIENLFWDTFLISFEDLYIHLSHEIDNVAADEYIRKKAVDKRNILINILRSKIFPEVRDIYVDDDPERANDYIELRMNDGWYRLSKIGYGYQTMLAWLMDFVKKMFDHYPDSPNPLKEPAVLLIDEIDLHLHPYWQRTIIKYLSDLFTQTQFIVTTHSPFILQSMENVNLYTLRKEGDHTISTHLGNRSFIGWGIEEILSEIMELGDNIQTDRYQELFRKFDKALSENNHKEAKQIYDDLSQILHPENVERKLMKMQLSQMDTPDD